MIPALVLCVTATVAPPACDLGSGGSHPIFIDLQASSDFHEAEASLKELRTSVCKAWVERKPLSTIVVWTLSVDASLREEVRVDPGEGDAVTVCVTERQRIPNLQLETNGEGQPELKDVSKEEATTTRYDQIKILGSDPPRLLSDPADCGALDGKRRPALRLVNSTTGASRQW